MDYEEGLRTEEVDASTLGRRAARLRDILSLTVEEVAQRAGVSPQDVVRFETNGEGSIALLLAIVGVVSWVEPFDELLVRPNFPNLAAVRAYKMRRARNPVK